MLQIISWVGRLCLLCYAVANKTKLKFDLGSLIGLKNSKVKRLDGSVVPLPMIQVNPCQWHYFFQNLRTNVYAEFLVFIDHIKQLFPVVRNHRSKEAMFPMYRSSLMWHNVPLGHCQPSPHNQIPRLPWKEDQRHLGKPKRQKS